MNTEERLLSIITNKFLRRLNLIFIGVCAIYVTLWFAIGAFYTGIFVAICGIVFTMLSFYKLFGISVKIRNHIMLINSYLSLTLLTVSVWNGTTIVAIWLFLIPIGALVMFDRKTTIVWSIVVFLTVLCMPYLANHFPYTHKIAPNLVNLLSIIHFLGVLGIMVFLLFMYDQLSSVIVTAIKRKRRDLTLIADDLKKNQKYKDQFFANISHELRTPMNAIKGISEILEIKETDNAELVTLLKNSSNHLLSIINDLLDLSKIQAGKITFTTVNFDLKETLYSAYEMLKMLAVDKKLNYTIEIDDAIPQKITGDPNRLIQIIVNLLNNAIKFTQRGYVKFICKATDLTDEKFTLLIEVKDTGIGIKEEAKSSLFQNFYQADDSISLRYGGTGLGLSITKKLVELQGGDIYFESKEHVGTTFYVSIPYKIANTSQITNKTDFSEAKNKDLIKSIMIVDDNEINLLVAKKQLEIAFDNNIEIYLAKNGIDGINIILKNNIDVILMDKQMPIMDGIEATKKIRIHPDKRINSVPIIAMTANVGEKDIEACLKAGMNDFITKPFDVKLLLQKIVKVV